MLKISEGNSKLGRKLPNFSLPPGVTCRPWACEGCWLEGCYAQKFYNMYPNVRKAWDHNYQEITLGGQEDFRRNMIGWLREKKPAMFRIHVGGDFFSQAYLDSWKLIGAACEDTLLLAFTKAYDLDYSATPSNLKIIWSIWPTIELPDRWEDYPTAWLAEDERRPEGYHLVCPNNCSEDVCDYKCWTTVRADLPVIFKKH